MGRTDTARRSKIVCTIGPASSPDAVLESLVKGGMDVARLNFSHGTHAWHADVIRRIRKFSLKHSRPVAILQDLRGIKVRSGATGPKGLRLVRGTAIEIRAGRGPCRKGRITIDFKGLVRDARRGDRILIDDGLIELRVLSILGGVLKARVVEGGLLQSHKGVNLPGVALRARGFTHRDRLDLAFGLLCGVDMVAVSFVRTAADVGSVRRWLKRNNAAEMPIIAKIEKPEALDNIEAILEASDGLMVARGDLGVEVAAERVPLIQKDLIRRANAAGKPVITATQMLESMTRHARPTRAEAADVANAVLDGTDALMLSAETSVGVNPLRALRTMHRIIGSTERGRSKRERGRRLSAGAGFSEAVAGAAVRAASEVGATCIAAFTLTGYTARLLCKFRPEVPILAFTPSDAVMRRISLYWGVRAIKTRTLRSTEAVFEHVRSTLIGRGMAGKGQSVVITASSPIGVPGRTNLIRLMRL